MFKTLLPYRKICCESNLSPTEIKQLLEQNIITCFSLLNSKPYYGRITAYDFSARKKYNAIKQESINPSINGTYKCVDNITTVTITTTPHIILIIFVILFAIPCLLFFLNGISEFLKSFDIIILFNVFIPIIVLYGIFLGFFLYQSKADIRFWMYVLQLKEKTQ